jgi:predicted nucleic acid-binding protein
VNPPLVAATGGLLRALARGPGGAASFPEFEAALVEARVVYVPALVLAEVDYFLREERAAARALLADILDPKSRFELVPPAPHDLARALELDRKFAELKLGLVDGTVAATAERLRTYRVLTTDRRDFGAIRVGRAYDRRLALIP